MSMFCFQCQETAKNQGCTMRGVCGKTDETANLQDLLVYVLKGISIHAMEGVRRGENPLRSSHPSRLRAPNTFAVGRSHAHTTPEHLRRPCFRVRSSSSLLTKSRNSNDEGSVISLTDSGGGIP